MIDYIKILDYLTQMSDIELHKQTQLHKFKDDVKKLKYDKHQIHKKKINGKDLACFIKYQNIFKKYLPKDLVNIILNYLFMNIFTYDIYRTPGLGNLCGYLSWKYPLNIHIDTNKIDVHGGITYEDHNEIGFDCIHYDDYVPRIFTHRTKTIYKDVTFVKSELDKMYNQIIDLINIKFS